MNARFILAILAVLIICLPIAIIVTILLIPLWSWIEATYGIESVGHSGPSDWCFEVVYVVLIAVALSILAFIRVHLRPGSAKTT